MRFNFDAYEKVYPEMPEAPKPIETAVEGFNPTAEHLEEKKPMDDAVGVADKVPEKDEPNRADDTAKEEEELCQT